MQGCGGEDQGKTRIKKERTIKREPEGVEGRKEHSNKKTGKGNGRLWCDKGD